MAAVEYQFSDLIEINELARELTTPNDVAEERFGGVGMSAMIELLDALRQKRLRVVQLIPDAQGRVAEQIPMDAAALVKGIPVAVYDRMQPTPSGRALYCTLATVAEIWPQLASVEVWRAREAAPAPAPVAEEAPAVADQQAASSDCARLRPVSQVSPKTLTAIEQHLLPLGALPQEEARAEINKMLATRGLKISRERFRELDNKLNRPRLARGEHRPKAKGPA